MTWDTHYADLTEAEYTIVRGIRVGQTLMHGISVGCGWYHNPVTGEKIERNVGEMIALMHSELSEALEADRKDLMDDKLPHRQGVEAEIADLMIRALDFAEYKGFDLGAAIVEKARFNKQRADHKLENRAKAGGKKY